MGFADLGSTEEAGGVTESEAPSEVVQEAEEEEVAAAKVYLQAVPTRDLTIYIADNAGPCCLPTIQRLLRHILDFMAN